MPPRPKQKGREIVVDWRPQEKQLRFLRAAGCANLWGYNDPPQADDILYGGAAGGGKTDSLIAAAMNRCLTVKNARVIYFRRTFSELSLPGGVIDRALTILPQKMSDGTPVYKYLKDEHKLEFFSGATLTFSHLQHEADKTKFKSSQVDMVLFDELTTFTETMFTYFGSSRVRKWREDLQTFPIRLSGTNPGSVGHLWVKSRYIDSALPGQVVIPDDESGIRRLFIPAKLIDNQILMRIDTAYQHSLKGLPEADRKALMEGDWDSYSGQFFSEWSRRTHVIKPFEIPNDWERTAAYDWGHGSAAVHLWFAMDPDTKLVYCYREYVTAREKEPGRWESFGVNVTPQAMAILEKEREGKDPSVKWRAADPSIFRQKFGNTGEFISDTFANDGVYFEKSDNPRVHGWQRVRAWLTPVLDESGKPLADDHGPIAPLRFFDTCRYTVATIPSLPYDLRNVEDLDTGAEDHAADAVRYWAMNRPEPSNLSPIRLKGGRQKPRHLYADEIEDMEDDDTPPMDERGLLMPVRPRRGNR